MSNQRLGFGGALNGMTKSHLLNLFISDQLKFNNGGDLISWDLQEALNDDFVISRDGTDILTLTPTGDLTVIGSISTDCISDVDGTTRVCIADVTDVITFETNSLERMRISTAGLVGIGTNSPGEVLDVTGNINVTGVYKIDDINVFDSNTTLTSTVVGSSLTSVGTLTSLTMGGDIAMGTNDITGATNITATNLTGTLQTAAQGNVTSLGTLTFTSCLLY